MTRVMLKDGYESYSRWKLGSWFYNYQFVTYDGYMFRITKGSLKLAREERDIWLKQLREEQANEVKP